MSVAGVSVGSGVSPRAVQPVSIYDPSTGMAGTGTTATPGNNSTSATGVQGVDNGKPVGVKAAPYNFLGYQTLTAAALASSQALPSIPAGATGAIIQNNTTQGVRFRTDGATTAPTATSGQRIAANGTRTQDYGQASLTTTRLIIEAAGTGSVDIEYYS